MTIKEIHDGLDYYRKMVPVNYGEEKKKFFNSFKKNKTYNPQFIYDDDRNGTVDQYLNIKKYLESYKTNDKIVKCFVGTYLDVCEMMIAWHLNQYKKVTDISGKLFGSYKNVDLNVVLSVCTGLHHDYHPTSIKTYSARQAGRFFLDKLKSEGLQGWKIEYKKNATSEAAIFEEEKKIVLKEGIALTKEKLSRFIHHEITGHGYQTFNGVEKYKKYHDWLIGYIGTEFQYEGIAIFTEINNLSIKHVADMLGRYLILMLATGKAATKTFYGVYKDIYKITKDKDFSWLAALRSKRGWRDTSRHGCFQKENSYLLGCLEAIRLVKKDEKNYLKLIQGCFPFSAVEYLKPKPVKWVGVDTINEGIMDFFYHQSREIMK